MIMRRRRSQLAVGLALALSLIPPRVAPAAEDSSGLAAQLSQAWQQGRSKDMADRFEEALRLAPNDYRIHKAHGDFLTANRRNDEALASYRQAAKLAPDVLEIRWAIWALLDRLGGQQQAILSLQEIARLDPANPLVHIRLARALSQVDRLEEAVASYQRAVELAPDEHAFRLLYARALYDVLDYTGARREIDAVLARAEPVSREWAMAKELLAYVRGETHDKGRRFDDSQTLKQKKWYTEQNLKDWVLTRGRAWKLMEQNRYAEAEGVLRQALIFNPEDHRAIYDLGRVLMELDRYEEAITWFQKGIELTKFAEFYPDSVFQIGRCLAKLGRWQEAVAKFERVLEIRDWRHEDFYALNFPDLVKVQEALDESRRHVQDSRSIAGLVRDSQSERLAPPPHEYPIPSLANGKSIWAPVEAPEQFASLGMDTTRGSFRQVMTARDVVQDDLQTGLHEYIPVSPTDTFVETDEVIYVVFTLTSTQEDEVALTSQWVAEQTADLGPNAIIGIDKVLLGLNERSGYFQLGRPRGGWAPGLYRVDLYLGPQASAYAHVGEAWFRVVAAGQAR
jgi:tetratricopeptide (TPR) repeat protein